MSRSLRKYKCPFCYRDFNKFEKVVAHLLDHKDVEVGGRRLESGVGGVLCWCGRYQPFSGTPNGGMPMPRRIDCLTSFTLHLIERGGIEAHLLEIALGSQAD